MQRPSGGGTRLLWVVGVGTMAIAGTWTAGCGDDGAGVAGPGTATASSASAGGSGGQGAGQQQGGGGAGGAPLGCTTTAPGPTRGSPIAVSPDDSIVVTVNRDAGTVTVLEVSDDAGLPSLSIKAEIAVGGEPWQVAIDGCGERAYVALRRDQKVVAIDDLVGMPVKGAEVIVGSEPTAVALSPNNTALYVASWVDGTVAVLDPVDFSLDATVDLNSVLAETGMLGPTVSATNSRLALAHPRSLAITNDGDMDDTDETLAVTEFFGQRTEAEAANASNADFNWQGFLYSIALDTLAIDPIGLSPMTDTGFNNHTGALTGCFPNQIQSVSIRDSLAYVTSICASPLGPVGAYQKRACTNNTPCTDPGSTCDTTPGVGGCTLQCTVDADCGFGAPMGTCVVATGACKAITTNMKTMTHPVVHIVDLAQGAEVASGPINLNKAFDVFYTAGNITTRRYPLVPSDVAFDPSTGDAFVVSNGADAVFRVSTSPAGALVSVGSTAEPFVDLGHTALAPELVGQNAIGVAMAHAGGFAFVASDVSRTVTAIDLSTDTVAGAETVPADPRVAVASPLPSDLGVQARLRGKRAFNTGLGRWSLGGQAWSACQVCHFEGLSDNITWYFARGPRQSSSLDGSFASGDPTDQRIFNWTGVFDEIEDFENVARGLNGAVGALVSVNGMPPVNANRINLADTTAFPPSGAVALHGSAEVVHGVSVVKDWADIKAWIQAVRSPRAPSSLDATAVAAGKVLFEDLSTGGRCQGCHGGAKWTLSKRFYQPSGTTNAALLSKSYDGAALVAAGFPAALLPAPTGQQFMRGPSPTLGPNDQIQCVLRPVGTYDVAPAEVNVVEVKQDMVSIAQGNDANGKGYNVPSLLGLSVGAPYMHAGNARTLEELLDDLFAAHRDALAPLGTLSATELDQLVAFLLSIDEATTPIAVPSPVGASGGDFCVFP